MNWDESKHPRRADGEFTHSSIGSWALKAAGQLGEKHGIASAERSREAAKRGDHPAGHADAKARLNHLWDIADHRERTDAEQAELEALEGAFNFYREEHLALERDPLSRTLGYRDERGLKYTQHGEFLGMISHEVPQAARMGFQRVGEHPTRLGSTWAPGGYLTPSTHVEAGGLWIDPDNPGTKHAPRYLNDVGHLVGGLRPKKHRSEQRKGDLRGRREANYGVGENVDHEMTWQGRRIPGRLGYSNENEGASEFMAYMKRAKARAKVEAAPKQQVRRTPKGTQVEGWMGKVGARMEQKGPRHG